MAAAGEPSHQAALTAFATRLIGQGEMLVEKQPGMAYALAALAVQVHMCTCMLCMHMYIPLEWRMPSQLLPCRC